MITGALKELEDRLAVLGSGRFVGSAADKQGGGGRKLKGYNPGGDGAFIEVKADTPQTIEYCRTKWDGHANQGEVQFLMYNEAKILVYVSTIWHEDAQQYVRENARFDCSAGMPAVIKPLYDIVKSKTTSIVRKNTADQELEFEITFVYCRFEGRKTSFKRRREVLTISPKLPFAGTSDGDALADGVAVIDQAMIDSIFEYYEYPSRFPSTDRDKYRFLGGIHFATEFARETLNGYDGI